jgi:hypothetical protein
MRIFTTALILSALSFGTVGIKATDATVNQTASANQTSVKLAKVQKKRTRGKNTKNCRILNVGGGLVRYVCLSK